MYEIFGTDIPTNSHIPKLKSLHHAIFPYQRRFTQIEDIAPPFYVFDVFYDIAYFFLAILV